MAPTTAPREVNDVAIISVGIALWVIALIVFLLLGASRDTIGTCAAGVALGLWGLRYVKRRRAQRENHASS